MGCWRFTYIRGMPWFWGEVLSANMSLYLAEIQSVRSQHSNLFWKLRGKPHLINVFRDKSKTRIKAPVLHSTPKILPFFGNDCKGGNANCRNKKLLHRFGLWHRWAQGSWTEGRDIHPDPFIHSKCGKWSKWSKYLFKQEGLRRPQ